MNDNKPQTAIDFSTLTDLIEQTLIERFYLVNLEVWSIGIIWWVIHKSHTSNLNW